MTAKPVQQRGVVTRQALVQAGRAEFNERGWEAATVRGVVERAGVSTGTFYRYFDDMSALLHEVAACRYDELRLAVELDPDATKAAAGTVAEQCRRLMQRNCERIFAYHRGEHGLHAVLTQRRYHDPALEALAVGADQRLHAQTERLLTRWGVPPREASDLALVIFHLIESTVLALVASGRPRAPVFEILADMAAAAVVARAGAPTRRR